MSKQKEEEIKTCGTIGKTARSMARSLLGGIKVDKKEGKDAVAHINECDFCKMRIKNHIYDAREGKKGKGYLNSLPETLLELQKLIG